MDFISPLLYLLGSLAFLVFVTWLAVTVFFYQRHRQYGHIPSPKMSSFYFGHLPAVIKEYQEQGQNTGLILKWRSECGPLFVIFYIHRPTVVTMKMEDIKLILMNAQVPKPSQLYSNLMRVFNERFMGQGLVTTVDYDTWRPRRSLYDPTFTKNNLKSLIPAFNDCVDVFIRRLSTFADGKTEVLIKDEFGAVTLDVIGKVAFGTDLHANIDFDTLGLKVIKEKANGRLGFLIEHTLESLTANFENPILKYWDPKRAEGYREAIRALRKIGRDLTEKRILAVEREEEVPNDILTQMLRTASTRKMVNVEDLVDDFVTFFVAGQETTALLLSFTIIMFDKHPDIFKRVLEEIFEVLGERTTVTAEDLEQLKYLEQVFSETLRMFPPANSTTRITPKEMVLSGYTVPAGTIVEVSTSGMHYNPEYWENPEDYDPERFGPTRPKPSPFFYMPFSTGHRSCIGKVFAMMEAKIIMSRLLSTFKVSLSKDFVFKCVTRATFKPAGGVPCTLTPL